MNFMSIGGFAIAMVVCALAMTGGFSDMSGLHLFIHPLSLIIVIGGTLASVAHSFSARNLSRMMRAIARVFSAQENLALMDLATIVDVAKIARKNVLAVENSLPDIENEFLREGLQLVVDRIDREMVIQILMSEVMNKEQQRDFDAKMLKKVADLSPAWGMIGTLFGLVILLTHLDGGAVAIGNAMATAIITTLYGCFLSNAVFLPWHNKTMEMKEEERISNEMIRDGVLMIEAGVRPELIEQDLIKYLNPDMFDQYQELKASQKETKKQAAARKRKSREQSPQAA